MGDNRSRVFSKKERRNKIVDYKKDFMSFSKVDIEKIFRKENVISFNFSSGKESVIENFNLLTNKVKKGELRYSLVIKKLSLILTRLTDSYNIPKEQFDLFLELFEKFRKDCYDYNF